ncbi:hypothetical protein CEE37_04295 [candidate division LCP-89 bacterium B3_LCP]|uniref:Peptidase M16 n=1 Tax=candidate division LCP-89 bacterium B3_LCP TaxID=2012998 RepID=A0A532V3K3_UNCL8|nr:MAG: hypothetical protein CEE37_04295 [candidate division LCP-89 bacterium B3_LCP]
MNKFIGLAVLCFPLLTFATEPLTLHTLDNGLIIYTKEDHARPLVSLFSIVDGGSRTETDDIAGLSHFYEHLIARGGSKRQAETEYRRQMMVLGQSHIYTYDDGTAYGFTVPRDNFDEALWRLADFMMDLIPDTSGIRKERTIVMEELHMSYTDNPSGHCYEQLMQAAFTEHPYYPTTIGLAEVIETTTLEKLQTFYQERYVPNQIVMAVVGDFDTDEIVAKIDREFGKYPSGKISFELGKTEPQQTSFRQVSDQMEVSSDYIMLGYHIPPTASSVMPALMVLTEILGGSDNSRLQMALRINDNLAYSVHAYTDFLRDASMLFVGMQCEPEKERAAIEKTFAEIQRLGRMGISNEELEGVKRKLITEDILKSETYRDQAEKICHYHIRKAPALVNHYSKLIEAVTTTDVQAAALKYLDASQATLSLVMPEGRSVMEYASLVAGYSLITDANIQYENSDPGPHFVELENGLRLIVQANSASPTACVTAYVQGGQWLEAKNKSGSAYLTTKMLRYGTEKCSREEISTLIDELGIELWNQTHEDFITVGMSGLSDKVKEGLDLLDQMLFHSTFLKSEFENAKARHVQTARSLEDQPWEYTHTEALSDLYQKSPYRNPAVGNIDDVEDLKLADVRGYYTRAFVPANMVIVAVGDIDPNKLIERMQGMWGELPSRKAPLVKPVFDVAPKKMQARSVYKRKDQNTFNISFLTVGVDHPDFLPLVVTKRILNTRLFFKYVYDKGMAYRMWTRMHPRMGQARFYFEMGCSDENFPIAVKGILQDLDAFLREPISKEILNTAKNDEITRNRMSYQTNRSISEGYGYWETVGLGYQFFEEFPNLINEVTAHQVEKAARKYLSAERYQLVNVGTAKVK